ncbi:hypothetical protein NC651_010515 [Populus alba x Populus x berolinensis]|nr:hypothetical protein NC651_010515 [Populus alba x Populus x berolinensis]
MNGLLVYPLWVAFDCGHAPLHLAITKTINYKKILLSRELPSSRLGFQWLSMRQHNHSVPRRGHLPDKRSGSSRHSLFDIKDMTVFCLYSVVVRESKRAFLVNLFKRRKVGWAILPPPTETTTSLIPRNPPHAEIISLPFFGIFIKTDTDMDTGTDTSLTKLGSLLAAEFPANAYPTPNPPDCNG